MTSARALASLRDHARAAATVTVPGSEVAAATPYHFN